MDIYECEWVWVGLPMPFYVSLTATSERPLSNYQEVSQQKHHLVAKNSANSGLKFGHVSIPNRIAIYSSTNRTTMVIRLLESCRQAVVKFG